MCFVLNSRLMSELENSFAVPSVSKKMKVQHFLVFQTYSLLHLCRLPSHFKTIIALKDERGQERVGGGGAVQQFNFQRAWLEEEAKTRRIKRKKDSVCSRRSREVDASMSNQTICDFGFLFKINFFACFRLAAMFC